jgi:hypothetical protein
LRDRPIRHRFRIEEVSLSADPTRNVVVFQFGPDGETAAADAPTLADDCVRQTWATVRREHAALAADITALHSEWEPSAADARFLAETFPAANLTYSFSRPHHPDWPAALEAARRAMEEAEAKRLLDDLDQATQDGELLPILWGPTDILEVLPHHVLVPDRLYLAFAMVAPTPRGTIGMSHLTHHTRRELGDPSLDDLLDLTLSNLRQGLGVEAEESSLGVLLTLHRPGSVAAAAIALPDFHQHMSTYADADRLVVGVACQDHLLVTAADSVLADHVQDAVLNSPRPDESLIPTMLSLDASGLSLLA